jgi:hypothetical protein
MEKIMSKSNDVSTRDHRPLADSELDAVTGGFFADYAKQLLANSEPKANGSSSWFDAMSTALDQASQ